MAKSSASAHPTSASAISRFLGSKGISVNEESSKLFVSQIENRVVVHVAARPHSADGSIPRSDAVSLYQVRDVLSPKYHCGDVIKFHDPNRHPWTRAGFVVVGRT